jgi:hypothetical protein
VTDGSRPDQVYQHNMRVWEAQIAMNVEMFKGIIAFATLAIKSLILVNGAAVIALLTLLGHLWAADINGSTAIKLTAKLGPSFTWYTVGVGAGVLSAGFSYFAQVMFVEILSDRAKWWWGNGFRIAAVVSALISFGGFVGGGLRALTVFNP